MFLLTTKTALQRDLDRFYKALSNDEFNIREVTKGALSQSRSKLNPWAFQRLNEVTIEKFYQSTLIYTWYGFRILSVDGSRLMLPSHKSIREEFGVHSFGPAADAERSMAMISMLYDTLNHLTLDAQMAPYASSERDLLMTHLDKVEEGDLLLLDRGYPCFWLLFLLKARGVEFCVRLKDDWWLQVKDFVESGQKEMLVKFSLPKKDREKLSGYPEYQDKDITCRLVRVELEDGRVEVLCTSLLDDQKYVHAEFQWLYHYRWNEEEAYKLLKARAELEAFSGKTAKAVRQDFFAKIFLMTLCAAYAHPIEEKVYKEYQADQQKKHAQKINRTHALATLVDMIVPIFLKNRARDAIEAFDKSVENTREIIRPGRSNPRPKKPRKAHYQNYKPI